MIRATLLPLVSATSFLLSAPATAGNGETVYASVAPSIVRITVDKGFRSMLGSGVIVGPGRVVTNCHVAQQGQVIELAAGKKTWAATLSQADPANDICMLDVPGLAGPAVTAVDTSSLRVGQVVYAVGNPEGMNLSMSEGIVSAIRTHGRTQLVQTTAAISPGSSGGGLFDDQGRLVGITSFKIAGSEGLNFAVSAQLIPAVRMAARLPAPGLASPRLDWAAQLAQQSDPAARIEICRQWAKAAPRDLKPLRCLLLAQDLPGQERLQAAVAAHALAPLDRELMMHYAQLLEEGTPATLRIARVSGFLSSPVAWTTAERSALQLHLGRAYVEAGQHDKALQALESSAASDPQNAQAWETLARQLLGNPAEMPAARSALQKALKLRPQRSQLWQMLASTYAQERDWVDASLAQQQAIDAEISTARNDPIANIFPESASERLGMLWADLAQIQLAAESYDEALRASKAALEAAGKVPSLTIEIRANLYASESHIELGDKPGAVEVLQKAVAACDRWEPGAAMIRDAELDAMLGRFCGAAWQRLGVVAGALGDTATKRKARMRLTILDAELAKTLD